MNADDRATPPAEGFYRPAVNGDPAQPQGIRPMGATPPQPMSASHGTTGQPGTSGQVPQRAPFRSGQFPTTAPATSAQFPTTPAPSGARPTAPAPAGHAFAPATPKPAPHANEDGALGSIKGFAMRAKDVFTEGDDLKASSTSGGPRRVRVLVSRVDPLSALKIGFLLSIAAGIMLTVAVYVVWNVLNQMGLFALANDWISKLFTADQELNLLQFFDQNKVMSAAILVSVINVVLLSALTTIGAFLYNTVSSVVGGIYLTLTDD